MPSEPLDPMVALNAIRTFAKTAVENDQATAKGYELILREILNVCDQAIPKKPRAKEVAIQEDQTSPGFPKSDLNFIGRRSDRDDA